MHCRSAILSPRSSLRRIKLPAWIFATIFFGTGVSNGDSSIGVACGEGSGVVTSGTGAVSSGMVELHVPASGVSLEATVEVRGGSRATNDISDVGGSVPSGSAEENGKLVSCELTACSIMRSV